jgi:hypothetical protein
MCARGCPVAGFWTFVRPVRNDATSFGLYATPAVQPLAKSTIYILILKVKYLFQLLQVHKLKNTVYVATIRLQIRN